MDPGSCVGLKTQALGEELLLLETVSGRELSLGSDVSFRIGKVELGLMGSCGSFVPTTSGDTFRFSRKGVDFWGASPYRGREWDLRFDVATAYKTKARKVRPSDVPLPNEKGPGGESNWVVNARQRQPAQRKTGKFSQWLTPRLSNIKPGSRLTPARIPELVIGEGLTTDERELFLEMLQNREGALAFTWEDCGTVHPDVAPPQKIRTVAHTAWQSPGFPLPKALIPKVIKMLRDRIERGVLEYCDGPYRNPWFLVAKKVKGEFRLINAAMDMNKVTVRDANLPPSVDEFSEEFAGCSIASLVDLFSGYDQIVLDPEHRDMTAFQTPIGLLRMTRLPQGATNSVAQFVRIITNVLVELIPEVCLPFLDDIGVKGPRSTYQNEEIIPGIRRYVMEHIQSLDKVLERLELAGLTIGPKSQFCMKGISIVGFVTGAEGRWPESSKIIKILEWGPCANITDARAFIGVCVYFRIWVSEFSLVAEPIYRLFKKGVSWNWGQEQDLAMATLKEALTTAPALVKLDYREEAGEIIVGVDGSLLGWGAFLGQLDEEGQLHPSRYESGLWNPAEQNYDATKRECRSVLKALRKLRYWLYGVHFVLQTDAKVLVAQLSRAATDLPGALVTRWIAWIRLFDFEVRHIPGKRHTAADGLSRRPRTASDNIDEAHEVDIDDWIMADLNSVGVHPVLVEGQPFLRRSQEEPLSEAVLGEGYSEESNKIARYLTTLIRPMDLDRKEYTKFKSKALNFAVREGHLFRVATKIAPLRRVIDKPSLRQEIIEAMHDELGHKGVESTYRKVNDRYYWENCHRDVKEFIKSCDRCQFRNGLRQEEALYATWVSTAWEKVGVDVVHMPPDQGKNYLVTARCDLSGWPEARALAKADSNSVAKFLFEEVVCRHGCFGRLVVDGGPENKKMVEVFTEKYGIKRVQASAYHAPGNGMVERGHRPITEGLSKRTNGGLERWVSRLPAQLLAERTTIHQPTGVTPFYFLQGRHAVLPIETRIPTWRVLEWDKVRTREDLIALRTRQLELWDEDIEEFAKRKQRHRERGKEAFDNSHRIRKSTLQVKDIVLHHDPLADIDKSRVRKLAYRWFGPYRISAADSVKGYYSLEELDGTQLKGTFAGNRLKRFVLREGLYVPDGPEEQDGLELPAIEPTTENTVARNMGPKPDWLQVQVPTLTETQKAQYTVWNDEDESIEG
jgi:RNase H-like domain found in reverse transcriptase/Integrase zinc binding domain/Reverse transcriptase (RNA-dependent DNA polymerase)